MSSDFDRRLRQKHVSACVSTCLYGIVIAAVHVVRFRVNGNPFDHTTMNHVELCGSVLGEEVVKK